MPDDPPRDGGPGRADRLRQRAAALEHDLDRLDQETPAAWAHFDQAQAGTPEPARLTYDQWYAELRGPQISAQRTELAGIRAALHYWDAGSRDVPP